MKNYIIALAFILMGCAGSNADLQKQIAEQNKKILELERARMADQQKVDRARKERDDLRDALRGDKLPEAVDKKQAGPGTPAPYGSFGMGTNGAACMNGVGPFVAYIDGAPQDGLNKRDRAKVCAGNCLHIVNDSNMYMALYFTAPTSGLPVPTTGMATICKGNLANQNLFHSTAQKDGAVVGEVISALRPGEQATINFDMSGRYWVEAKFYQFNRLRGLLTHFSARKKYYDLPFRSAFSGRALALIPTDRLYLP